VTTSSYARKTRIGHIFQRSLRTLRAPLLGQPHLQRQASEN
jgi:hypothetical protein